LADIASKTAAHTRLGPPNGNLWAWGSQVVPFSVTFAGRSLKSVQVEYNAHRNLKYNLRLEETLLRHSVQNVLSTETDL